MCHLSGMMGDLQPNRRHMTAKADLRIGISGWRYKPWRGTFYPNDLAQRRELEFASRRFNSIELNGSFYSLQRADSFKTWHDETPDDFQFSIKGSRYVTHMRRLLEVETPLANFFAQRLLRLDKKLGPILWQFPPSFRFDPVRLDAFFKLLPKTRKQAATLGRRHDERLDGRSWLKTGTDSKLRHAMEIRHDSFVCEEFIALLRKHEIALVVADTVEWPRLMDVTADFVYCRLHGSEQLYASGYDAKSIRQWAQRVVAWSRGQEVEDGVKASSKPGPRKAARDVYVYFDNDMKVRAPFDAESLRKETAGILRADSEDK
jgi:uncharacterized protein YecE (DUF72 family)